MDPIVAARYKTYEMVEKYRCSYLPEDKSPMEKFSEGEIMTWELVDGLIETHRLLMNKIRSAAFCEDPLKKNEELVQVETKIKQILGLPV